LAKKLPKMVSGKGGERAIFWWKAVETCKKTRIYKGKRVKIRWFSWFASLE
jgi:hypothetical protein